MSESSWLISAWKANVSVSEAMARPSSSGREERGGCAWDGGGDEGLWGTEGA
jgi:hypothetical protein